MYHVKSDNPKKERIVEAIRKALGCKIRVTNVRQSKTGVSIRATVHKSLGQRRYALLGEAMLDDAFGDGDAIVFLGWNGEPINEG